MTKFFVKLSQRLEVLANNEYEAYDIAVGMCEADTTVLVPDNMSAEVLKIEEYLTA